MMKKSIIFVCVYTILSFPALVFAYGEGPSSSGRWVEGTVRYGNSMCKKCRISVETNNGFSKTGFTDSSGAYKIYIASQYVKGVYVHGKKVWSGSKDASGGVRINVSARQ